MLKGHIIGLVDETGISKTESLNKFNYLYVELSSLIRSMSDMSWMEKRSFRSGLGFFLNISWN